MRLQRYVAPLRQCDYLPEQESRMVYAEADGLDAANYLALINQGWRRFGYWLFRPECPKCRACQPIRVPVAQYKPNRSQRRIIKENSPIIRLVVDTPSIDESRVNLYFEHHKYRAETRSWRDVDLESTLDSIKNFIVSPIPVQEWAYYLDDELVAISYVDQVPDGYSGIYFYHSPKYRHLSLGNWICISMILRAQEMKLDYVYFGYYVKGNISMEYKAAFAPNQILEADGSWQSFKR